jgi:hypothetical protein
VYTATRPNSKDLVGVYVPDANTLALIAKEGNYRTASPTITLMGDGTIVIKNIPDWWLTSFGVPGGGFDSGRGTWTIQESQDWWLLLVSFSDTRQFASSSNMPGTLGTQMKLIGEKPPYKIYLTVGDPDEGRGMHFERLPPGRNK